METWNVRPLGHWRETVGEIARLARIYQTDAARFLNMDPQTVFRYVADLPYHRDPPGQETVARPIYLLQPDWTPRDCDDKTVLIGAWAELHGLPWRIVVSSKRDDKRPHHVFPEVKLPGLGWTPMDATYPKNQFGIPPRRWTWRTHFTIKPPKTRENKKSLP